MVQLVKMYISLIVVVFLAGCNGTEHSIRLIPKGYQGPVMIVYNQKDGADKEYEDNKRVYRIPESGILETQFDANFDNPQSLTFYYITKDGKRSALEYLDERELQNRDHLEDNAIYVFSAWSGSSGHSNNDRYKFETFLVGKVTDMDSLLQERISMTFAYQEREN